MIKRGFFKVYLQYLSLYFCWSGQVLVRLPPDIFQLVIWRFFAQGAPCVPSQPGFITQLF